jgi:hypothetical protein
MNDHHDQTIRVASMRLALAEQHLDQTRLFDIATGVRLLECERAVLDAERLLRNALANDRSHRAQRKPGRF